MLATCAGCYLLWWGVAFYPERHAPLWLSGILLVATAVCGIMAVNWMSQGIFQTEGIRKGVSGGWIMAGGVICYVVLLVISNLVFHRMVTTELLWLELCFIKNKNGITQSQFVENCDEKMLMVMIFMSII